MERKGIGAPSRQLIDEAIKELWGKVLQMSIVDAGGIRPALGDHLNVIIPQLRVTFSMFNNPYLLANSYFSALENAREGIVSTYKKLGLEIQEFRGVSTWSKHVSYEAFDALKEIVFVPMYEKLRRGDIYLLDVNPTKKDFLVEVKECGECWGFPNLNLRACQYLSGTLAGIWTSMIGVDYGAYEENCLAQGDTSCTFKIAPIKNRNQYARVNEYITINPPKMYATKAATKKVAEQVAAHIKTALEGRLTRPKYGDTVHLVDYQLRLLTSLSKHPMDFSIVYYHAGYRFGRNLPRVLESEYGVEGADMILKKALPLYYETLKFAKVESVETFNDGFKIIMKEVADCAGLPDGLAPHAFLCGELAGIATETTGQRMECINTMCRSGENKICEFKIDPVRS